MDPETSTQLQIEHDADSLLVRFPRAELDIPTLARLIRQELLTLKLERGQTLIVDFGGIDLVSGEILALLLSLRSRVQRDGGTLTLRRLSASVDGALRATRLDRVFETEGRPAMPARARIAERAYELWQRRGPESDPLRNWLDAEAWLSARNR